MQRIKLKVPGVGSWTMQEDDTVDFSLPGLRAFLNKVEMNEGYFECFTGTDVRVSPTVINKYVESARIEAANE